MKDDVVTCLIPTDCDVAYLSPDQCEEYGGQEQAKRILGVSYIAKPEVFFARAEMPDLGYVGHA